VPELTREQLESGLKKYTAIFIKCRHGLGAETGRRAALQIGPGRKNGGTRPRLVHISSYIIDDVALPLIKFRIQCSKAFTSALIATTLAGLGCGAHLVAAQPAQGRATFPSERALSWDALQKRLTRTRCSPRC